MAPSIVSAGSSLITGSGGPRDVGYIFADGPYTLAANCELMELSIHVHGACDGPIALGVYDATGSGGGPGNLLAQCYPIPKKVTTTDDWMPARLITPLTLVTETNYWLVNHQGGSMSARCSVNSGKRIVYKALTFSGVLPTVYPTSGTSTLADNADPIMAIGIAERPAAISIPTARQGWLLLCDSYTTKVSDTSGNDAYSPYAMGCMLEQALNAQDTTTLHSVVHLGLNGGETSQFLPGQDIYNLIPTTAPTSIFTRAIIELGLNDGYANVTKATYKSNLQSIIAGLFSQGFVDIYLAYPPYICWGYTSAQSALFLSYADAMDELADTHVHVVGTVQDWVANNLYGWYAFATGNIHPLDIGGIGLASTLAAGLLDLRAAQLAADIATVDAAKDSILSTATILTKTGTYVAVASQYVLSSAPSYGIGGTGGAKTATIPSGADVQSGASVYGVNGTSQTPSYPTTAATQAAQLASDQSEVSAKKSYIYPNADILEKNDGTLRASNIGTLAGTSNLTPSIVALGTTIDDVVGTSLDTTGDNTAVVAAAIAQQVHNNPYMLIP